MLENLPRSKKIGHQLVKNKQFTQYESISNHVADLHEDEEMLCRLWRSCW